LKKFLYFFYKFFAIKKLQSNIIKKIGFPWIFTLGLALVKLTFFFKSVCRSLQLTRSLISAYQTLYCTP